MVMTSLISVPTSLCSTSTSTRSALYQYYSSSSFPCCKTLKSGLSPWIPQLAIGPFSLWSGLKHLGISINTKSVKKESKVRCKGRVVYASLFGVGAPEALVIGVVALLVFGPKGLAEVARNLGKTLRAFQPTIRELQDVSREFKSTLEREIGLDDIPTRSQNTYTSNRSDFGPNVSSGGSTQNPPTAPDPNGARSQAKAYTTVDYLKISEQQLKDAALPQQGLVPPSAPGESQSESQSPAKETASPIPPPQKPENEV